MHRSPRLAKPNIALFMLAAALAVAVAVTGLSFGSAAASGGLVAPSTGPRASHGHANKSSKLAPRFGHRTLREGMKGKDVRILKGIVRSKRLFHSALNRRFDSPTTSAVKRFQRREDISRSGVVNKGTSRTMVRSLRRTEASWYGPGLYGNGVACGGTLRRGTIGVAHKTLPCGSKVLIGYHGRFLRARVIDRGPYIRGRALDLTYAAAERLNFIKAGVANVRYAVVKRK